MLLESASQKNKWKHAHAKRMRAKEIIFLNANEKGGLERSPRRW